MATDELKQAEARITELEFQLAHQQKMVDELNGVLVGHTQQILRMERNILRLEEQIKIVREQRKEAFDPGLEKPPHY